MKVHFYSLFFALCLGLIPAGAMAQTVTVLGINSVEADDNFAYWLSASLRGAARDVPGWEVRDREVTLTQMMGMLEACQDDFPMPGDACAHALVTSPESGARGDLVIYGTIHRDGVGENLRIVVELRLYEAASARMTGTATMRMTVTQIMTQEERNVIASQLIAQLTGIAPGAPSAGTPHPAAPLDLEYVAWPLIGLAAASLFVEIGLWSGIDSLSHDPDFTTYRSGFGTGTGNVCAMASGGSPLEAHVRSVCSQGDMLEALEWVFMAVGIVSAGVGATLLALDLTGGHESSEHALLIRPVLSSTSTGFDLVGRF